MGYIFETEIEQIMNAVSARTIGEAETIRLRDLLAADLHPAIKAYFKARVRQLLQQERTTEVRSKKFPYSLPEVMRLQEQVDVLLVHYYSFGQHDFALMLDHAVHFQFNFLCRPQWTLLNFIFENQRRRPTSDIRRKLRYCVDYEYYAELIKRLIDDRGLAEIEYEEFKELLEKIDNEIVSRHSSVELALLTRPLLRFIESSLPVLPAKLADSKIPINAAVVFFEDKKLNDIKDRLETERDKNGVMEISLRELAVLIERVRTHNEEAEVDFPEGPADPAKGQVKPAETPSGAPSKAEPVIVSKAPVKIFSDFEEDEPITIAIPRQSDGTYGDLADTSILVNLHSLFSPSEEKTFIKKVFQKEELLFRESLDQLNKMTDWKEASQYLQQIFLTNEVDPFSEVAIMFTDKVQRRFQPGEAGKSTDL
ncbi:MAG TPA: hypothetical protein DEP53_01510 [Bacteroidetes bacterium]|nr:hypothetical protein [Bacteroidota bacterium]